MQTKPRKVLSLNQQKAIALLILKDVNGLTNAQIAEQVGVSVSALYRWFKADYFNDALLKQAEELQRSFIADAYTQLRSIVQDEKVSTATRLKAIELVLKNQGRLKEVREVEHTVEAAGERSITDLLLELDNM